MEENRGQAASPAEPLACTHASRPAHGAILEVNPLAHSSSPLLSVPHGADHGVPTSPAESPADNQDTHRHSSLSSILSLPEAHLFLGDGYHDFQDSLPNSQGLSEPSQSEASLPRSKETKQDALGIPEISPDKFYPSSKDMHQEAPRLKTKQNKKPVTVVFYFVFETATFSQLGGTDTNFVLTLICIF